MGLGLKVHDGHRLGLVHDLGLGLKVHDGLENDLDENIGRWEMTWFNFHILHLIYFIFVGYDLYQYANMHEISNVMDWINAFCRILA